MVTGPWWVSSATGRGRFAASPRGRPGRLLQRRAGLGAYAARPSAALSRSRLTPLRLRALQWPIASPASSGSTLAAWARICCSAACARPLRVGPRARAAPRLQIAPLPLASTDHRPGPGPVAVTEPLDRRSSPGQRHDSRTALQVLQGPGGIELTDDDSPAQHPRPASDGPGRSRGRPPRSSQRPLDRGTCRAGSDRVQRGPCSAFSLAAAFASGHDLDDNVLLPPNATLTATSYFAGTRRSCATCSRTPDSLSSVLVRCYCRSSPPPADAADR